MASAGQLHETSGRSGLGLTLAFATAFLWATLSIALKVALEAVDPYTLTWFRFLVAFALFGGWSATRGGLGRYRALSRRGWGLLAVCAVGLTGNYIFYLLGLDATTPANAQLLIQLAPLTMAIGGVLVFHERFGPAQRAGALVLLLGLGLFFRDQLVQMADATSEYLRGSGCIVIAALTWAAYALCQKQLLRELTSADVLTFIFGFATIVLLPWAQPASLGTIDGFHWVAVIYCALNTLMAYSAFAESLAHLEASRVSAVLAVNPLMTLAAVTLAHLAWPDVFDVSHVAWLGLAGAVVAVFGSLITSLLGRRPPPPANAVAIRPALDEGAK
ncbi:MAG: DMT family transporter [Sandaracinaceae bacterium]